MAHYNRLHVQVQETSDGKGLGLFATHDFSVEHIVLEVDALFAAKECFSMTPKRFAEFYSEVTEYFDGLREKSERKPAARPTEVELEQFLSRPPLFLSTAEKAGVMRGMLCELVPGWKYLDEDLKELEIQQLSHFVDGARKMHDFDDNCLGFSVYSDLINHSCVPNAFMSISRWSKRIGQPEGWNIGGLQVQPLRPISRGEEITISYEQTLGLDSQARRELLRRECSFDCKCQLCQNEDPAVQSQVTNLAAAFNSCFDEDRPHSQIYRLALAVFLHSSLLGYVDFPLVTLFEHLRILAMRNDDLLRANYFNEKAWTWCVRHLGSSHDRTREYRHISNDLYNRGTQPLLALVETEQTTDLIFMANHEHEDEMYHYLRYDPLNGEDGPLIERMRFYSKRMAQLATEKRKKTEAEPQ